MKMKIWLVNFDDLTCAWTKREDAISYFHNELKRINASIVIQDGNEKESNDALIYSILYEDGSREEVVILPTFLDTKPYWD